MKLLWISVASLFFSASLVSAQNLPEVKLKVESATPRTVESKTEQSVARDYAAAWRDFTNAAEKSSPELLNAYFTGNAKATISRELVDQQKTNTHVRYLNQTHNLKAVFYAPEGDVLQLVDYAEYQMQIVSDDKVIHDEHVLVQYIVLMTPGEDRWVIRQLQATPEL